MFHNLLFYNYEIGILYASYKLSEYPPDYNVCLPNSAYRWELGSMVGMGLLYQDM